MKPNTKLIPVAILLSLASYLFVVNGCGKAVSGHTSGGCADNTAPAGASMKGTANLGVPFVFSSTCYPVLTFTVTDASGAPMNGICVELYDDNFNASIALHSGLPDCHNAAATYSNSMIARTDSNGNVMIELYTGPTATGKTHFVQAQSGAIGAILTTPPAAP